MRQSASRGRRRALTAARPARAHPRVPTPAAGRAGAKADDNVVDAEFEEVRDKGRRAS